MTIPQYSECNKSNLFVHLKMVEMINFMIYIFYHNKKTQKKIIGSDWSDVSKIAYWWHLVLVRLTKKEKENE